jgi:dTDP-4-amino-4,6-dideoxygalactose transaminase
MAAGIGPGDEVIVPALTFAATANVVVHCGATPVFADVLPGTHCIDPAHVTDLIGERTRAIIPVHYAGIPCEMDQLRQLASDRGLFLMEDCAHAIEAEYRNEPVGVATGSRFAAYSFYATKNLITGEGGMLACGDARDLERATVLGLHGMSADAWKRYSGEGFRLYDIIAAGFKYNMFDLQAALGLVQLAKLDENWRKRHECVLQYDALIENIEGVTSLSYPTYVKPAHHLYVVRLDDELVREKPRGRQGIDPAEDTPQSSPMRDEVISALRLRNVEAYVHYICLPETTFYRTKLGAEADSTPVASSLSRRVITLPLYPGLSQEEVKYVAAMLQESLAEVLGG